MELQMKAGLPEALLHWLKLTNLHFVLVLFYSQIFGRCPSTLDADCTMSFSTPSLGPQVREQLARDSKRKQKEIVFQLL